MIERIWKLIDHNMPLLASLIVAGGVLLYGYGCQSQTTSPISGEQVSREQLQAEVQAWQARHDAGVSKQRASLRQRAEALAVELADLDAQAQAELTAVAALVDGAFAELDRQDEFKAAAFDTGRQVFESIGGPIPATIAMGIGLVGAIVNGRRKDVIIEAKKNGTPAPPPTPAGVATS